MRGRAGARAGSDEHFLPGATRMPGRVGRVGRVRPESPEAPRREALILAEAPRREWLLRDPARLGLGQPGCPTRTRGRGSGGTAAGGVAGRGEGGSVGGERGRAVSGSLRATAARRAMGGPRARRRRRARDRGFTDPRRFGRGGGAGGGEGEGGGGGSRNAHSPAENRRVAAAPRPASSRLVTDDSARFRGFRGLKRIAIAAKITGGWVGVGAALCPQGSFNLFRGSLVEPVSGPYSFYCQLTRSEMVAADRAISNAAQERSAEASEQVVSELFREVNFAPPWQFTVLHTV
jgi:hypothetical protein